MAFTRFVGVLIDSFIVRSYMVPGLISLFGEASWWPLATPAGTHERYHPSRASLESQGRTNPP